MSSKRFVAIGDSVTEGVGDWNPRFPNGCRGWADRVARQLGKADPSWEYANLAIRSRRLGPIIEEQLEQALALEPSLMSFYAGGNDLLEVRLDLPALLEKYDDAVARMRASGAEVMLLTGYDMQLTPWVAPLRKRNWDFNAGIREIAARRGCLLIDHFSYEEFEDPRLWNIDRLHMSTAGHRALAARVLQQLQVEHTLEGTGLGEWDRATWRQAVAAEHEWMWTWVVPMVGRRMRGVTLGDELEPKWPYPIRPAEGMKRNARVRRRISVPKGAFLPPDWEERIGRAVPGPSSVRRSNAVG